MFISQNPNKFASTIFLDATDLQIYTQNNLALIFHQVSSIVLSKLNGLTVCIYWTPWSSRAAFSFWQLALYNTFALANVCIWTFFFLMPFTSPFIAYCIFAHLLVTSPHVDILLFSFLLIYIVDMLHHRLPSGLHALDALDHPSLNIDSLG